MDVLFSRFNFKDLFINLLSVWSASWSSKESPMDWFLTNTPRQRAFHTEGSLSPIKHKQPSKGTVLRQHQSGQVMAVLWESFPKKSSPFLLLASFQGFNCHCGCRLWVLRTTLELECTGLHLGKTQHHKYHYPYWDPPPFGLDKST